MRFGVPKVRHYAHGEKVAVICKGGTYIVDSPTLDDSVFAR
jgi:hypothetical protein